MTVKIIGASLIIFASAFLGLMFSREAQGKLNTMYEIQRILIMLKGEITYNKAPVADAFINLSRHTKEPFATFFQKTGEELDNNFGKTLEMVWRECCDRELKELVIAKEDKLEFREFGACMGYLDVQMQVASLALYGEKMDMRIKEYGNNIKEKQRIFKIMGVMGGIFLVLIMA